MFSSNVTTKINIAVPGRFLALLIISCLSLILSGCAANQPVVWDVARPMDLSRGAVVSVTSTVYVPDSEMEYLQHSIQANVNEVLRGLPEGGDIYRVAVTIIRYDEGNAFLRMMLIGLGSMHLYGTVEITEGEPPVIVRSGEFKKIYALGGILGGMSTMHNNVVTKVGKAIADAIRR